MYAALNYSSTHIPIDLSDLKVLLKFKFRYNSYLMIKIRSVFLIPICEKEYLCFYERVRKLLVSLNMHFRFMALFGNMGMFVRYFVCHRIWSFLSSELDCLAKGMLLYQLRYIYSLFVFRNYKASKTKRLAKDIKGNESICGYMSEVVKINVWIQLLLNGKVNKRYV